MTPAKKTQTKMGIVHKDGYGMHWHMVGWLSAIALILSASTMTLSATAATTPAITPTVLYRSLGDIHTKLNRIEGKIDRINAQLNPPAPEPAPNAPAFQAPPPTNDRPNDNTAPPAPSAAVTQCRMACEDDFNACNKQVGQDQVKYAACKTSYESCWNKCAQ